MPLFFGVALSVIYVPVHNRRSSYLCALIAATVRHTHTHTAVNVYMYVCVYSTPPQRRRLPACLPACIHYMQISIICTNQTHKMCQQQQQPPPPAAAAAQQRIIIIIDFIMASRDRRPRSPLLLLLLPSSIGRRTTNVQFNFCASFALLRSVCVCVCASFIGKQEEP